MVKAKPTVEYVGDDTEGMFDAGCDEFARQLRAEQDDVFGITPKALKIVARAASGSVREWARNAAKTLHFRGTYDAETEGPRLAASFRKLCQVYKGRSFAGVKVGPLLIAEIILSVAMLRGSFHPQLHPIYTSWVTAAHDHVISKIKKKSNPDATGDRYSLKLFREICEEELEAPKNKDNAARKKRSDAGKRRQREEEANGELAVAVAVELGVPSAGAK
jgi:hypothetical protein